MISLFFYMLEPFVQIKYVIMCTLFCLFKKLEISAVIEITEEWPAVIGNTYSSSHGYSV